MIPFSVYLEIYLNHSDGLYIVKGTKLPVPGTPYSLVRSKLHAWCFCPTHFLGFACGLLVTTGERSPVSLN